MTETAIETHTYQAEVARLLHMMVHAVYTEKEVFLRELIANASDALDKLRYRALTETGLTPDGYAPAIILSPDVLKRTLTIADNGIGMNRAELIDNLGTIARSGTRAFLDALPESETASAAAGAGQIGQFGIGFYAAFMVAERIEVRSRKAGELAAWLWASDGAGGFTVSALPDDDERGLPPGPGTAVTLFLRDDALQFMEEPELERIIETYSAHIQFPIRFSGGDDSRQLNSGTALWTKPKAEVTPEQYRDFYRQTTHQFDEPALTIHYRAEGRSDYAVLLFVPGSRPFDLFDPGRKGRVKLYVRRVFISDDADLLPGYLRFIRGVIDSHDMPLNISREMLQNNATVAAIRKAVCNRVLTELKTAAEKQPGDYTRIWETFGPVVKEGLYEDPERRDRILDLCRFRSTEGDSWRSLSEYVAALKPNQTAIYYLVGDDISRLRTSPHLEGFRARGIEVLLLADPVDAFWVTTTLGFDGKPFKSITQDAGSLDAIPLREGTDRPEQDAEPDQVATIVTRLQAVLGSVVSDVRVSPTLMSSPACLVAPAHGPDRALGKLLDRQAQAGRPRGAKPVLEINPRHTLMRTLAQADASRADDLAWTIFDQARIVDGEAPIDAAKFAERLTRLLAG